MHHLRPLVQTNAKQSLLLNHGRDDFVVVTRHSIHLQDHVFAAYSRRVRDAVPLDACYGHVSFHRDAESLVVHRAHEVNVECIRKSSAVDENRIAGRDGDSTEGATSVVMQHLMRAPWAHAMPALELRLWNGVETHGTLLLHFSFVWYQRTPKRGQCVSDRNVRLNFPHNSRGGLEDQ